MALVLFIPQKQWKHPRDLASLQEIPEVNDNLDFYFGKVNPATMFAAFMEVKTQLATAKAAVGSQPCNVQVTALVSGYHDVVHDCWITSTAFCSASLKAMQVHKMAYDEVEDEDYSAAAERLSKIHIVAEKMVQESIKMHLSMEKLVQKAEDALLAATKDESLREEDRRTLMAQITAAQSEAAFLEETISSQELAVQSAREDENRAGAAASEERDRAHQQAVIGAVMDGISMLNPFKSNGNTRGMQGGILGGIQGIVQGGSQDGLPGLITNGILGGLQGGLQGVEDPSVVSAREEVSRLQSERQELTAKLIEEKDPAKAKILGDQLATLQTTQSTATNAMMEASKMTAASAGSLAQVEAAQRSYRQQLEEHHRKAKSDRRKLLEQMRGMEFGHNDLKIAIDGLKLCIQTLGDIKVKLRHVTDFWKQISFCAQKLAEISGEDGDIIVELNMLERATEKTKAKKRGKFDQALLDSAYLWATVGVQCYQAEQGMSSMKDDIDSLMSDLPVGQAQSHLDRYVNEALRCLT